MISAETLLGPLLKNVDREYKRLLTELSIQWGKEYRRAVETANKKDNPSEQQKLLRGVGNYLAERNIRRDTLYEEHELADGLDLLGTLKASREEKGFCPEYPPNDQHPSILALDSDFLILQWRFSDAAELLSKAVDFGKTSLYVNKYPVVANLFSLCYCLTQAQSETALKEATNCRSYADSVAAQDDWRDLYQWRTLAPVRKMDPRIFGRLSELDVLVHRRDWKVGERVEARFQKLWEDAVREYEFPKSWRTDIKVKMLSDDDWAIRAPGYTLDVGKGAYIELGGNVARRVLRHLRANYGGFNIDYSAVAQPVAVLLCVGMLQQFGAKTENLTVSAALESERVVAILRENLEEDDAKEIHESLRDHLSDDVLAMTVREAASYSGMDFERSLSTSNPFLSSGDQTTERV